jgi:O-antigen/teichoic acid export membrane protein
MMAPTSFRGVATHSLRLVAGIRDAARASGRAGVPHYMASTFAVQGLAYLTQLTVARVVGPQDFAIVRTVESALNVLLVAASIGMPMLAVTMTARLTDERARGRQLGTLLAISAGGGVAVGAVTSGVAWAFAWPGSSYLSALVWVVVVSACSRTLLNYFLGSQQMGRVAGFSVVLALASLGVVLAAVLAAGLPGWVAGRYVSEVLFLALLIRAVGPHLTVKGQPPAGPRVADLLIMGGGIAASLLVRTATDNAGIFLLTMRGATANSIGHFGLASLAVLGLLIIPSSVGNVALPRIVARLGDPAGVRALASRVVVGSLAVNAVLALGVAAVAGPLVDTAFPAYRDAVPLLWILLLALPMRALSALSGMVLVARERVGVTVWTNLLALVATLGAAALIGPEAGPQGVAVAVVTGEAVSAGVYSVAAWLSLPPVLSAHEVH